MKDPEAPRLSSKAAAELELERLQTLVNELTRAKPQPAKIKTFMREAGLPYCTDPVERAETVLAALSALDSDA